MNAAPLVAILNDGTIDFENGKPVVTTAGGEDLVLAKFSGTGTELWAKEFGGPGDEGPVQVAYESNGNIALLGQVAPGGTIDFGGGPIAANDAGATFVATLKGDGSFVWSKGYGDPPAPPELDDTNLADLSALAIGPTDDIAVAGELHGKVNFGGGHVLTSTDASSGDVLLVKIGR